MIKITCDYQASCPLSVCFQNWDFCVHSQKHPLVKSPSAMVRNRTGIIIQAGGSAADGVEARSLDLGLKGQLEQWQGPTAHGGALLAVSPLAVSWETPERGKKCSHTKRTE